MINLDRKVGRWKSKTSFRKWLGREMGAVKKFRSGVTANRFLKLQKLMLGGWPMQKNDTACLATAIVSNFGNLSRLFCNESVTSSGKTIRFGDLAATRFRAITPLRPNTNLFFALFSYANRLNFNVTYNADQLRRTDVEFVLDSIKNRLLTPEFQQ